jgi:isopentenyl-diphosphate delta-isomerase
LVEQMQLVYRVTDPVSGLTEHEYLHVFRGQSLADPRPHPDEVGAWRWMSMPTVRRSLARRPGLFTPWFALLAERMLGA